jgi:hypothetical protein
MRQNRSVIQQQRWGGRVALRPRIFGYNRSLPIPKKKAER